MGNSALHTVAGDHEVEKVKKILQTTEGKKALNTKNSDGDTPLHLACWFGFNWGNKEVETIKLLIDAGAEIDAQNKVRYFGRFVHKYGFSEEFHSHISLKILILFDCKLLFKLSNSRDLYVTYPVLKYI